jgi:membrane protein
MEKPDKQPESFATLASNIWNPEWLRARVRASRDLPRWRRFLISQLEVLVLTMRCFFKEEVTLRAAALTYNTLLSIVPLLAVGFALFKAFGGLNSLEGPLRQFIVENIAVGKADEIRKWLDQFISNINAGAIAGIGVLFLFYSAIGLLTTIEQSFNEIWSVRKGRPLFMRFAIYWCLVTLTPILLGFSISLSAKFQSSAFTATVLSWLPFGLGHLLLMLSSILAVCLAFALVYLIVPSAPIKLRSALVSGLIAGLAWSASKYIFIKLTAGTLKYSAVYGALGVLPLLMLWMYVSWIIVLFGATYAYAFQQVSVDLVEPSPGRTSPAFRELLASRLLVEIAAVFYEGGQPLTAQELAAKVGAPLPLVQHLTQDLVDKRVLASTSAPDEGGFLPGQDLKELTLSRAVRALRDDGETIPLPPDDASLSAVTGLLVEAERASAAVLDREDLHELVVRLRGVRAGETPALSKEAPSPT